MKIFNFNRLLFASLCGLILLGGCWSALAEETPDPPEIAIGERLFLETRFAQAYYSNPQQADPAVSHTITSNGKLPGPFRGKTMNCRSCHLVDEHQDAEGAGMRTYADFAPLSPVPGRNDGKLLTGRNSMSMVNVSLPRKHGALFHFDGEFNSLEDLVRGTLTGRNFGWLPGEQATAIEHIAHVIRSDDGKGELAKEFGGSYQKVFLGTAKDLATQYILPEAYKIDVDKASDQKILDVVARLIGAYLRDLEFSTDEDDLYNGSPYDRFLELNNLPRTPLKGESLAAYNNRLYSAVNGLKNPRYVTTKDGHFAYHKQAYAFAEQELTGMKLFLRRGNDMQRGGNCAACHQAPHFSDYSFHNTGLTQINYDQVHGKGMFMQLDVPGYTKRNDDYNRYLPATTQHPEASSRFRNALVQGRPGITDLGLWNVYANPDMPGPQPKLTALLCKIFKERESTSTTGQCGPQQLLPLTIATFKTPVLRDLGHSDPYMHTGQFDSLDDAVSFYITSSALAGQRQLRNGDPALQHVKLAAEDVDALVAFLKALNEDYD